MLASVRQLLVAVAAVALLVGPAAAAAQDMTTSDVTRLEQTVDRLYADLAQLRQSDRAAARSLEAELMTLDEEVTYLKVKLRRERNVSRADYMDVRDRLEKLSARVSGRDTTGQPYPNDRSNPNYPASGRTPTTTTQAGVVPMGTELDVRLEQRLSSDTARVEDRFEATTVVDLRENNRVVIPAGSRVRGVVTSVRNAGRLERRGELQLSFDQITINGRNVPIRGTVTEALEAGGYRDDAEKIGAGAAVGAVLGGILGGVRGAITGILIGGGGVVAATEGQDVDLPSGTILRMRLDQDVNVANLTRQ
jgi:outer membrane murein-binding lipoprotein Lpp